MPKTYEGKLSAEGLRFAIVVSRFNEFVTSRLLAGALDALQRHGAKEEQIEVVWTPGSFEIPLVAARLANSLEYNAVVCLGAIIRGATPHFEYVAAETAKGIGQAGLDSGVPVIYGIVTADSIEQAIERAGTKSGNRGFDAALAAMEMANLLMALPESVADLDEFDDEFDSLFGAEKEGEEEEEDEDEDENDE